VSPPYCMIRPAALSDVEDLFLIAVEFATSFAPERPFFESSFREILGNPSACLLVAEINGQVIAYLLAFSHPTFFANGAVVWVEELAVHSSCRRRGIGRALMEKLEAWAALRRARLIALGTRRAGEFYRVLGFEESAAYYRKLL
jgi:ribosomal protein S18 acetylase RimI-like enzyme